MKKRNRVKNIDAEETARLAEDRQGVLLLDVRRQDEYDEARIAGSLLLPLGELEKRLDEIEKWKDKKVVIYCHAGVRSLYAADILLRADFEEVYNLEGGIISWVEEGLPIEQ